MKTAVSCRDLSKQYPQHAALTNVSFDVVHGRITGLLGPNGSGKTTTLKALLGLTTPTSGHAHLYGKQHSDLVDPWFTVGACMDQAGFRGELTAPQVLRIAAIRIGAPVSRVPEVLETVGLGGVSKRIRSFSYGMTQRLRVAMAILGDPELLILDEPINGLDPQGIRWLRTFLRAHADNGGAVLISSHQLNEAEQLVDDVVVIAQGEVLAAGATGDLLRPEQRLEDFFFELTDPRPADRALHTTLKEEVQ